MLAKKKNQKVKYKSDIFSQTCSKQWLSDDNYFKIVRFSPDSNYEKQLQKIKTYLFQKSFMFVTDFRSIWRTLEFAKSPFHKDFS